MNAFLKARHLRFAESDFGRTKRDVGNGYPYKYA